MSKDPIAPDNLADLRRTLPGLGVGDGSPVPVQEVSAADVERVLGTVPNPQTPTQSPASSTEAVMRGTSSPEIPLMRGTSSPGIPVMRGTSSPGIPVMRGTSSPGIPVLRSTSNSAIPMLRTTGAPGGLPRSRPSETSIPSQPPAPNRLPFLIVGLGALALAIGTVAWLHPGQNAGDVGQPPGKTDVVATSSSLPTGGVPAVVPVRTVAQPATVVVVQPVATKPPKSDKPDPPAARKPPEETNSTVTSSKPPAQPATTPAKPATPKAVVAKVDAKAMRTPQLDLSPVPQLSREIMRQHMTVAEPKWQACPKDGSGKNLSIGIVVAPSGSVVKAEVMGPAGSTQTAHCITDRIRNMRFPAYSEGGPKTFFWSYQVP